MGILKFAATVVGVPVVAVFLLAVMIVGFVIWYVAWLAGVPVKVTINGKKYRYRWTTRVR